MAKIERQLISRDELNDILTREIRKISDLEDATLTAQYVLEKDDETGCNWSGPHLGPGSRASFDYAAPHMEKIIRDARTRFKIKD